MTTTATLAAPLPPGVRLAPADVAAVADLAFEVCRRPLDPEARAARVLQGILELSGADGGAIFHGAVSAANVPVLRQGRWKTDDTTAFASAVARGGSDGNVGAATAGSPEAGPDWGATYFLWSSRERPGQQALTIGIRRFGAPFSAAQSLLVRAVHGSAVGSLLHYRPPPAPAAAPPLPPRVRQVLAGLKDGGSEKQLAASLGISAHTVHIYVKRIYRHYGVNSRAEFMRLWIGGAATAGGNSQISSVAAGRMPVAHAPDVGPPGPNA